MISQSLIRRDLVLLLCIALVVRVLAALPMQHPGYMDAYYYVDGALSLYRGQGFNESFIWNYLDDPATIPHPSHLYWMPLSSMLIYPAFLLMGPTYRAAQVPFVMLSSMLALLSYLVAYRVAQNRRHAWCAGLFVVFGGFYAVYWATPDNFAPFGFAAALCLFSLGQSLETGNTAVAARWFAVAGLSAGLAHLARSDGALLVGIAGLVGLLQTIREGTARRRLGQNDPVSSPAMRHAPFVHLGMCYVPFVVGYLAVMGPWFVRNMQVIGRPLSAAGMRTLWLTDYDDLYSYGKTLSLSTYLEWGWANMIRSKLHGLWLNLQTLLLVNWMVALAPFGLFGVWRLRRRAFLAPVWLYGLSLYVTMSMGFTLPGVRGAMLHSSVALLPFLFAAAMDGLDGAIAWVASRRPAWNVRQAQAVFSIGFVGIVALLTVFLYALKLPVYRGEHDYEAVAAWMQDALDQDERVMVNDPAAFYYYSQRECLVVPNGDVEVLLEVAARYQVRYLVLDRNAPSPLMGLYEQPEGDGRFEFVRRFQDREGSAVNVYRIGLPGS